jgi:hypothetical protein
VDGRLSGHDAEKNRISICIPAEAQRRAGTQEPHAHSGPTNVIPAKAGIQTSSNESSLDGFAQTPTQVGAAQRITLDITPTPAPLPAPAHPR